MENTLENKKDSLHEDYANNKAKKQVLKGSEEYD